MRRIALIGALAVGILAAVLASGAEGDGGPTDSYQIRAYFDSAGFLVKDEEIRIAGATVGTIDSVDVTRPGEPVFANGDDDPGKAVVVFNITDPGFQDFRSDASCIIRPQSLLGEKFVECKPTEAHSSLTEPPPELSVIPDGETGAGQRFLPIDNNGKAVDVDLVNNIYRQPEVDKFRLILNDLGAGLAARGQTLNDVILRADPALQQTDRVLKILADQNDGLAQLTAESDRILAPLARESDHIAGFINNATIAGEAAAERSADIEQGFADFPAALRELEPTMVELRRFAVTATPVAADLRAGADSLTGITKALGPFADAATPSFISLGDATEASLPDLLASRGLIKDLGVLGEKTSPGAKALDKLLATLRLTGGREQLYNAILNLGNAFNGFDNYGHYLRSSVQINNCLDITTGDPLRPGQPVPGCSSKWLGTPFSPSSTASALAGGAAANANPTLDQIVDAPNADIVDAIDEQNNAGKLGKRGAQAAEDLLGYLTDDGAPAAEGASADTEPTVTFGTEDDK